MITGIDHVQVAAPPGGEEQARAFYGGMLGMPEVPKPESLAARGGCWFAAGDQHLHVGMAEPFAPAAKAHPALRVDRAEELHRLAERLAAAGRAVTWDDALPDAQRFYVADPFGNRLELVTAGSGSGASADTP